MFVTLRLNMSPFKSKVQQDVDFLTLHTPHCSARIKPRTILGILAEFFSLAELVNNSDFYTIFPPTNINFNLASARS